MNRIKAVLQKCWQYEIVHAAVYSALLNMLVECFNRRSLIGLVMIFTNPVLFLYNTLIILVTMSVVLLFRTFYPQPYQSRNPCGNCQYNQNYLKSIQIDRNDFYGIFN